LNLVLFSIPQEILLQLGTATVLVTLLGGKAFLKLYKLLVKQVKKYFEAIAFPFSIPSKLNLSQVEGVHKLHSNIVVCATTFASVKP
jgi:hypothetical protein